MGNVYQLRRQISALYTYSSRADVMELLTPDY